MPATLQLAIVLTTQSPNQTQATLAINGKPTPPIQGDDPADVFDQITQAVAKLLGPVWDPDGDEPQPGNSPNTANSPDQPNEPASQDSDEPEPPKSPIPTMEEMWHQESANRLRKNTMIADMS